MTTHYDVLGVTAEASADDIKRAYYRQARLYHPDSHVRSAGAVRDEAERAMQTLNIAWDTLSDAGRRAAYDESLRETRRRSRRRRGAATVPELTIGSGFEVWLGSTGFVPSAEGGIRLNLRVRGATSLEPLRSLAPNGLWGLHAEHSAVDDQQLRYLQGMTGLQLLDLTATRVTDAGLIHLLGLERLETLTLWDTAVTDGGLDLIGRLPNLRQLGLGNTAVTDKGLRSLADLPGLKLVQLWGTGVVGPGLEHLHRLSTLEMISLPWRVRGRYRRRLRSALPLAQVA